jgi:glycosyltransferase involved in cell wall biosynthesis
VARIRARIEVHLEWLHLPSRCWFLFKQAHLLAKSARKRECHLVVSFLPYTNAIAILAKLIFNRRLRVIVNVHSIKSRLLEEISVFDRTLISFLVRKLYGKADLIVAVAQGVRQDLVDSFNLPADKIRVINNPIDLERIRGLAAENVDHPWLHDKSLPTVVAVGRLTKVKGYDLLIRAFAMLPETMGCRLMIIGEGEERAMLEQLTRDCGLDGRVAFLGFKKNPWKYMRRADCLVLSSRSEALPNVIGEALAVKLPVLATDCSLGVREYLSDGQYGVIVPPGDATVLSRKMEELLTDHELRQIFAERSVERAEDFALYRIVEAFESTIAQLLPT